MNNKQIITIIGVIIVCFMRIVSQSDETKITTSNPAVIVEKQPETKQKPKEEILPENRLGNGEVISKNQNFFNKYGHHKLTIDNSEGGSDAIIKLVPRYLNNGKSVYTAYVREGNSVSVGEIPNGEYEIYFTYCKGFNYGTGKPLGVSGSQKADKIYNFQTTIEGNYEYSKSLTITLYKTVDGNLSTDYVSQDTFDNL